MKNKKIQLTIVDSKFNLITLRESEAQPNKLAQVGKAINLQSNPKLKQHLDKGESTSQLLLMDKYLAVPTLSDKKSQRLEFHYSSGALRTVSPDLFLSE